MKRLPLYFRKYGVTFRQVKKEGHIAMYERSDGYVEVIRISIAQPGEAFGKSYGRREVYPSPEQFGTAAFCFRKDSPRIQQKFNEMVEQDKKIQFTSLAQSALSLYDLKHYKVGTMQASFKEVKEVFGQPTNSDNTSSVWVKSCHNRDGELVTFSISAFLSHSLEYNSDWDIGGRGKEALFAAHYFLQKAKEKYHESLIETNEDQ